MRNFIFIGPVLIASTLSAQPSAIDSTRIQFVSDGYTLHGKLLLPIQNEKVPAIIFLVGSGGSASHNQNYKIFVKENLEALFLQDGIALLYFDKRGVNNSEGKWYNTDFYQRAEDAVSAIHFLKKHPAIDPTRIGIVGHSQGGWISQIVAANYPGEIAWAVSLSGPAVSVREQMIEDFKSEYMCKGVPENKAAKKAEKMTAFSLGFASIFHWFDKNSKQIKIIGKFDPRNDIRRIQIPFLYMFGENDELVNPGNSITRLHDIFEGKIPGNLTVQTIKGATHSFYLLEKCYEGPTDSLKRSTEFHQEFKNWVNAQLNLRTADLK